jgi:hypothetical protein
VLKYPGRRPVQMSHAISRTGAGNRARSHDASGPRSIDPATVPTSRSKNFHAVPDPPAEMVSPANERSRHHLGERAVVCARSVLGGLHHEYSLAPALT